MDIYADIGCIVTISQFKLVDDELESLKKQNKKLVGWLFELETRVEKLEHGK